MSNQQINEVVKALAYGETPEQIVAAECVDIAAVHEIQTTRADEITEERVMLKKVNYIG